MRLDMPRHCWRGSPRKKQRSGFTFCPIHWSGSFRNARAHRSPCCAGVSWQNISQVVTRTAPQGKIIRDIRPRDMDITEKQHCNKAGGCSDIVVDCYSSGCKLTSAQSSGSSRQESCTKGDLRRAVLPHEGDLRRTVLLHEGDLRRTVLPHEGDLRRTVLPHESDVEGGQSGAGRRTAKGWRHVVDPKLADLDPGVCEEDDPLRRS